MCAGVRGCSQACVGVFSCIWVRMGVHEFAVVRQWCVGVHGYMWVYAGVPGCAWVHVCGMNFQNTYWRLES